MPKKEVLSYYDKHFNSIYLSTYYQNARLQPQLTKFNLCFIVKRKQKNKTFFLYLLILFIFDAVPLIMQSRKKKNRKYNFLGFRLLMNYATVLRFVSLYLPLLDLIYVINTTIIGSYLSWSWNTHPIIYEVDRICEAHNAYLDYFQDYKFVFQSKQIRGNVTAAPFTFRFFRLPVSIY